MKRMQKYAGEDRPGRSSHRDPRGFSSSFLSVPAVDVVFDPESAHPNIVLSADGKQAGRGELLQIVPDNPKRFDPVICVVAKKGFVSGRFYFQVG